MPYFARFMCVALLLLMALSGPAAAAIADDFNDNSISSMYALIEDDPGKLWLGETNQRLELRSSGPGSSNNDALYLSSGTSGFQLLTSSNFQISIEYSFASFSGTGESP